MAWTRPTLKQIIERIVRDMESRLTGLVALLKIAALRILAAIFGGAIHILYGYLKVLMDEYLPDKAKEMLSRHGYIWGVPRKSPEFASGYAYFTGTNGSSVEEDLTLQRGDGVLYTTASSGTIADGFVKLPIEAVEAGEDGNITLDEGEELSLTTAETGVDDIVHTALWEMLYDNLAGGFFAVGDTITNLSQAGVMHVTEIGIPLVKGVILSGAFEDNDNITNGTVTADVDGDPFNINEISGGVDEESEEDWRARIIQRIQLPPSGGSKDDVERWAGEVQGVDQGWCFPTTPSAGWVTVAVKAAGSNIVPSSTLLTTVHDYIAARICVTANVATIAIDPVTIAATIMILPNTSEFQNKITENLIQLLEETAVPGEDILIVNFRDAIKKSGVTNFSIFVLTKDSVPIDTESDIDLDPYEYPVLGTMGYIDF